jgi:hypothetical protein
MALFGHLVRRSRAKTLPAGAITQSQASFASKSSNRKLTRVIADALGVGRRVRAHLRLPTR